MLVVLVDEINTDGGWPHIGLLSGSSEQALSTPQDPSVSLCTEQDIYGVSLGTLPLGALTVPTSHLDNSILLSWGMGV